MTRTQPWTVPDLTDALNGFFEDGEAVLSPTADGESLIVSFPNKGDLTVTMTISGAQILASTLLWSRTDEANTAAFEEHALRMHKFLPLSTFGITTIDGQDWYELFGALSASSSLEDVGLELRTLAHNAVDVADARAEAA